MVILFLDIETLPGHESLREHIETKVKPPGTMTKPETIRQWEEEQKPLRIEEEYRKTSLRGHTGRILCIGYMKEAPQGATQGVLTGDERSILTEFWQLAADVHLFVGFNVLDFDLKYIWQRSVINGVPPSRPINFARYRSSPIFDVMQEWEKWGREYISLNV